MNHEGREEERIFTVVETISRHQYYRALFSNSWSFLAKIQWYTFRWYCVLQLFKMHFWMHRWIQHLKKPWHIWIVQTTCDSNKSLPDFKNWPENMVGGISGAVDITILRIQDDTNYLRNLKLLNLWPQRRKQNVLMPTRDQYRSMGLKRASIINGQLRGIPIETSILDTLHGANHRHVKIKFFLTALVLQLKIINHDWSLHHKNTDTKLFPT